MTPAPRSDDPGMTSMHGSCPGRDGFGNRFPPPDPFQIDSKKLGCRTSCVSRPARLRKPATCRKMAAMSLKISHLTILPEEVPGVDRLTAQARSETRRHFGPVPLDPGPSYASYASLRLRRLYALYGYIKRDQGKFFRFAASQPPPDRDSSYGTESCGESWFGLGSGGTEFGPEAGTGAFPVSVPVRCPGAIHLLMIRHMNRRMATAPVSTVRAS